jgi:hypothetical protein
MKQKEDLLMKDLSARLSYMPMVEYKGETYNVLGITHGRLVLCKPFMPYTLDECPLVEEVKPYLFPLTSITEEQYYEMNICSSEDCVEHFDILRSIQEHTEFSKWPLYEYRVIDFFHKNHFDYRGLIPMGLANDATGLNIY